MDKNKELEKQLHGVAIKGTIEPTIRKPQYHTFRPVISHQICGVCYGAPEDPDHVTELEARSLNGDR